MAKQVPPKQSARAPRAARRAALHMVLMVLDQGAPLSEAGGVLGSLSPPDRAAAQRLALATLRGIGPADALLAPKLQRPPPLRVQTILRLGLAELAAGGAAHGVVGDCVALAEAHKTSRGAKGLVNAVLRALAPDVAQAWAAQGPTRLPQALRKPLSRAWGRAAVVAMEAAHAKGAPVDLTAKGDPAALAEAVGGTLLPTGSVRVDTPGQISALPGYDDGAFWVQDAAAALPVRLLGAVAGARVLDLCAAPGGKTLQLAAAGADVTALDLSDQRLRRVAENLERTGLSARLVAADALTHKGQYDAVLLDAPCSATGTIRRHPDLPYLRDASGIAERVRLQARLLDHALTLVAPGGALVFATCSLIPDEGEAQITALCARHPDWHVVAPDAPWIEPDWRSPEGGLRLRPDFWASRGGLDGFYMARLERRAGSGDTR